MNAIERLDELMNWYADLKKENLKKIKEYYSENVFFKDPFNELTGVEKVEKIYEEMFLHLENPHFVFVDKIIQDNQAFLTWNFIFSFKQKQYLIHGSSHLKLNEHMLIAYHRDYWDVGEELLLKIPLIRCAYKIFRSKLSKK